MREDVDALNLRRFLRELATRSRADGRTTTADVDFRRAVLETLNLQ